MKVGLICDSHIGGGEKSPQKAYLINSIKKMKEDGITILFHLGDFTAFGDIDVYNNCASLLADFNAYILLGNAEMRGKSNKEVFLSNAKDVLVEIGGRNFLGLNTPFGTLTDSQLDAIKSLSDNDVVLTHYGVHSLDEDSKTKLEEVLSNKKLIYIHAHSHKWFDYSIGKSRVVGLRALDPDKSIGNYPCVTYFDTESNEFTETLFSESKETLLEISKYLGFSLANNKEDLIYAIENNVKAIELKLSNIEIDFNKEIENLINTYKKKVNGYISVHMPNVKYDGEKFSGKNEWLEALSIVKSINANGITVHPPKIKKNLLLDNDYLFDEIIDFYAKAFLTLDLAVNIGFENMHKTKEEKDLEVEDLGFGYIPEDLILFKDKVNERIGANRVFIVLDIGHTKNNGRLSSIYTIGRWLEDVGDKTVAYHIHQVISTEEGLKNHKPIENWFGPLISYASFFYCFRNKIINHVPIFIEVRGKDNYIKSIEAFNKLL